jgi:hypothetical protein
MEKGPARFRVLSPIVQLYRWYSGRNHEEQRGCPLMADIVAKVETRTTQKNSQKLVFGLLSGCVAL